MSRVRTPSVEHPSWGLLIFLAWLAGSLIYLWSFMSIGVRGSLWTLLLRPDDVVAEWVAWNWQHAALGDRVPIFALCAFLLLAAYGAGAWLWRLCFPRENAAFFTQWEAALFSLLLGLSLLSLGTLLLGLAGGIAWPWCVRLVLLLLAIDGGKTFCQQIAASLRTLSSETRSQLRQFKLPPAVFSLTGLLVVYFTISSLMLLWAAAVPPWDFDVREYHLQVPKEWYQQGRVNFLPHNIYAQMPLGAEMHPLLAMIVCGDWWLGALAGKVIMAAFVPITAGLIACAVNRWFSAFAATAALAGYVCLPGLSHTALHGLNEPALCAFGFAAWYAFCLGREKPQLALLVGWFAGSAVACKYPAVLLLVIPLAAGMMLQRFSPQALLKFVVAVTLACGPWLGKNWLQTGNPVYPLLVSTFGGTTRTPEKDEQFRRAHRVPRDSNGSRFSLSQGITATREVIFSAAGQSPLLLPLGLLAWLRFAGGRKSFSWDERHAREHAICLSASVMIAMIFVAWWLFTHRIERFWYPAFPFLTILAAGSWQPTAVRWQRLAIGVIFALGLCYQSLFLVSPLAGDTRWFTRLDLLRTGDALHPHDIARLPAAYRYLNKHAQPDDAVLCIGEAAVFDFLPRAYYHTCFDDSLAVEWLEKRSPMEQRTALAERRIAWIYVNAGEIARYRSPGNYGYDPRFRLQLIDELIAAKLLVEVRFENEGDRIKLYQVLPLQE